MPAVDGVTVPIGTWLERQVELLREAHRRGEPVAAELLKATGIEPGSGDLPLDAARLAIARDHRYPDWTAAAEHAGDPLDLRFEAAADAVQWGELDALRALLDGAPELVEMRSPFPHRAMLLHHTAANGIEVERQLSSPANAVAIMHLLLERGADPDAVCDVYGGSDSTLVLLVSSAPPAAAGVQAALVEELCAGGAAVDGIDDDGSPLWTAITFGYTEAAEALVRSGARVDNLVFAAALGDLEAVRSYFDRAGRLRPGRARSAERIGTGGPVLEPDRLLDYALIWAAAHDRREVVEFLLERGPDLSFAEPCFGATALGVARYLGNREMVARLEPLTAP
jgi:hypothetical protein